MIKEDKNWWKTAVIYQIWPYSFNSTSETGYGNLQGIIDKLDYIKGLGVDAIWLSPIFVSPNKDKGYDISDYKNINCLFGDVQLAEKMIQEAHKRGLRVLFDMVVNHTSNQHYWFQDAKKSKDSKYRDYYIFREGNDGKEPNDWQSIFSGPAWTYNKETDDYYLHLFDSSQPDLNWMNPKVREEIFDIVRFWMSRGVDGWRIDALCSIRKNPDIYKYPMPKTPGPETIIDKQLHDWVKQLCAVIREKPDAIIIGEVGGASFEEIANFTAESRNELTASILFDIVTSDYDFSKGIGKFFISGFDLTKIKNVLNGWYSRNDTSIALHIQSHDQPRIVSRWGDDEYEAYRVKSAKMLGTFNQMLKGLPIVYQGEEIGMTDWKFNLDQVDDVEIKRNYKELVVEKKLFTDEEFLKAARYCSRDNARTPVQWTDGENAGFSSVKPWLPVNDSYKTINVQNSLKDKNSIFYYYKKLIQLRKTEKLLIDASFHLALNNSDKVLAFMREKDDMRIVVLCNFSPDVVKISTHDIAFNFTQAFLVLIANYDDMEMEGDTLIVRPYETFVIKGNNK